MRRPSQAPLDMWLIGLVVFACTWTVAAKHYRGRMLELARYGMESEQRPSHSRPDTVRGAIRRISKNGSYGTTVRIAGRRVPGRRRSTITGPPSNTYYLESSSRWSGIAVDALEEFKADYQRHRPRTQFVAAFVSDKAGDMATFFVPDANKLVASASEEFTGR